MKFVETSKGHPRPLTVILPARHAASTIGPAIRSTLFAMNNFDEMLVVVDTDDPKTIEKVERIRDTRLKVIPCSPPLSLAEKLNLGICSATHDIVARMDADDISFPWRFRISRVVLERTQSDFVFSTAIIFGKDLRPLPILPQIPLGLRNAEFLMALTERNPAVHPTLIAKKSSIRSLGLYRDLPGEDLDLWLRAAAAGLNFRRIAMPLLAYRFSNSSLSRDAQTKAAVSSSREFQAMRLLVLKRLEVDTTLVRRVSNPVAKLKRRLERLSLNRNN